MNEGTRCVHCEGPRYSLQKKGLGRLWQRGSLMALKGTISRSKRTAGGKGTNCEKAHGRERQVQEGHAPWHMSLALLLIRGRHLALLHILRVPQGWLAQPTWGEHAKPQSPAKTRRWQAAVKLQASAEKELEATWKLLGSWPDSPGGSCSAAANQVCAPPSAPLDTRRSAAIK